MTNEKELRQKVDDIFEDMNSYTGEKLAEDELFDRVLELFHSHTKEVVKELEKIVSNQKSWAGSLQAIRDYLASLEDNKK